MQKVFLFVPPAGSEVVDVGRYFFCVFCEIFASSASSGFQPPDERLLTLELLQGF